MYVQSLSRLQLFTTPCTVARQAPLSKEFSGQEYWSGLSFPTPRNIPDPGIEPTSPASPPLCHLGSPYRGIIPCNKLHTLQAYNLIKF